MSPLSLLLRRCVHRVLLFSRVLWLLLLLALLGSLLLRLSSLRLPLLSELPLLRLHLLLKLQRHGKVRIGIRRVFCLPALAACRR